MDPVRSFKARAHREGKWWVIAVTGVGVTQTRTLDRAEHMAQEMIALMRDVDAQDVVVSVAVDLGGLGRAVEKARQAQRAAEAAQHAAAVEARRVVGELQGLGLGVTDIAAVLGVSRSRAGQLAASAESQLARKTASARTTVASKRVTTKKVAPTSGACAPGG